MYNMAEMASLLFGRTQVYGLLLPNISASVELETHLAYYIMSGNIWHRQQCMNVHTAFDGNSCHVTIWIESSSYRRRISALDVHTSAKRTSGDI